MGNNPVHNNEQSFLEQLGHKYQQLRKDNRGTVLLDKSTDVTYLLKEFVYPTESTFRNKVKIIEEQIKQGQRQFIINPVKVEHKVFNNFCSTSYKIYVIYEYPQVTLREEIMARRKQNKIFQEAELWSILQSCTNALGELKPFVSLNPNEIFINPDGNLKIIHDDLVQQNYRALITPNIYYAPQKLKNFNKMDSDLAMRKESIFSMGMTILEAAQLQQISSCYDYNGCSFNTAELESMISSLQQTYSGQFIDILNNILEVNPNRRASLMQIQKNLDIYWMLQKGQGQLSASKKDIQTEENQQQAVMKHEVLTEKVYSQNYNVHANYSKPYQLETHKELTFNNSKKYISYDPSSIQTPKNVISNTTKENNGSLYTDPKLFEMIRKDLQQINKLKQSTLYEPSRYTFMYPQTQNILNSIKNMNRESLPNISKTQQNTHNFSQRMSFEQQYKMPQLNTLTANYAEDYKMKQPKAPQLYNYTRQNDEENNYQSNNMKKQPKQNLIFSIETYENGSRYEGTTLNGKKHGYGKLIFEDGVYYQGQFIQDKMNGKGILYYSISQIAYDGEWCNDQFNGYGILYNENPVCLDEMYDFRDFNNIEDYWIKYEGNFQYDNKSGQGKLFLTNGQILDGQFKEDYVDGNCRFMRVNGQLIEGFWETNILTEVNQQY